jgi:hypothetical protein
MQIKFYIRVEGDAADVESFGEGIAMEIGGQVRSRKKMTKNGVVTGATYWRSDEVESSLQTLSKDIESFLAKLTTVDFVGRRVLPEAQVVVTYLPGESPVGFFLDAGLVKVLAKLGASLDIDVVV